MAESNVSRLRELLDYNADTGVLTWKVSRGRVARGYVAGQWTHERGYCTVRVDDRMHYGHRVAWMIYTGEQIAKGVEIDHRNGITSDNRIDNLRLALPIQNKRNMRLPETNTSGHRGVTWDKSKGRWQAQISVNNRCVYLGRFSRIEDAVAARIAAETRIFAEFSHDVSRGLSCSTSSGVTS